MTEKLPAKQVRNQDNLKTELGQWKPGVSGNPKGRPKKEHTLTSLIKEELGKLVENDPKGRTYEQALAEAIVKASIPRTLKGDGRLAELILERTEGRVPQQVTGPDGGPIEVVDARYRLVERINRALIARGETPIQLEE